MNTAVEAEIFSTQPLKGSFQVLPTIEGLTMVIVISEGIFFYIILSTKALVYVYVLGYLPKIEGVYSSNYFSGKLNNLFKVASGSAEVL